MTTTWGGTSLPNPTDISAAEDSNIVQYKVISGVLRTNEFSTGIRYDITWSGITGEEFFTIYGKASTYSSDTMEIPGYGSFTMTPIRGSLRGSLVGGASVKHNISCSVYRLT